MGFISISFIFLLFIVSIVNANDCLPSKPALSEFKNSPTNFIQGADTDGTSLSQNGYIWLDKIASKGYDNRFAVLHGNGFKWVRIMLYWNDTVGDNNLLYVTNVIRNANNNGLDVAVIIFLSDGQADLGKQSGPSCINLNQITLPTYYNNSSAVSCKNFSDLTITQKEDVIKEYSKNVVNYFKNHGVNVKLYEIGNEVDCGIAGIFNLTDDVEYLKN
jgi:arabinogalactan endo-1,4-beta-galactosidase